MAVNWKAAAKATGVVLTLFAVFLGTFLGSAYYGIDFAMIAIGVVFVIAAIGIWAMCYFNFNE